MYYPTSRKLTISVPNFYSGMDGSKDQNVLPVSKAKTMLNFTTIGGALRPGLGLDKVTDYTGNSYNLHNRLSELENVRYAVQFTRLDQSGQRCDYIIALCGQDLVAVDFFGIKPNKTIYHGLTDLPVAVNYNLDSKDVIIFSSPSSPMIVWDGEEDAYTVADAPPITSMVVHYERLFATADKEEKNCVWFSDDLNPTNWTLSLAEAGFIQMADERGACQRVVSFLDYVYVFREYGIARISGYGDQTQFLVSQLATSSGKIYPNTVTLCGNVILFLAEDGVYSFNGLTTTKILPELSSYLENVNNSTAHACAADGKWYLCCNMRLDASETQTPVTQVLLEYDIYKKHVCLGLSLNIKHLTTLRTENGFKLLAVVDQQENLPCSILEINHSGAVCGKSLKAVWKGEWSDLSYPQYQKIINRLSLYTKGAAKVTIETEEQKQVIEFTGNKRPDTRNVFLRGKRVRFTIAADAKDAEISGLVAEVLLR